MGLLGVFFVIAFTLFVIDVMTHRDSKEVSLGNAVGWTLTYVAGALVYACIVWAKAGPQMASLFLSGYVMEKALSIDNLMVFVAIFSYFKVTGGAQHKILHYGIIGAVVFRMVFVTIGAGSIALFGPWTGLVFAALVLWSAMQMWKSNGEDDGEESWYAKRWPSMLTKPFIPCLIAIELSDVMFSFDSVPAVIAVTRDPVMIYSAMIFAILGLRSLYFVLGAMLRYLSRLGGAVVAVLFFIGVKLGASSIAELAEKYGYHTPGYITVSPMISLAIVLGILAIGVIASILWPEETTQDA